MKEPTIVLKETNPFYDIFPYGMVPVKTFAGHSADLLDSFCQQCVYMMDGDRITTSQMQAVVERVAEKFGARVNDVRDELLERGLPIRASQVAVHPAIPLRMLI